MNLGVLCIFDGLRRVYSLSPVVNEKSATHYGQERAISAFLAVTSMAYGPLLIFTAVVLAHAHLYAEVATFVVAALWFTIRLVDGLVLRRLVLMTSSAREH